MELLFGLVRSRNKAVGFCSSGGAVGSPIPPAYRTHIQTCSSFCPGPPSVHSLTPAFFALLPLYFVTRSGFRGVTLPFPPVKIFERARHRHVPRVGQRNRAGGELLCPRGQPFDRVLVSASWVRSVGWWWVVCWLCFCCRRRQRRCGSPSTCRISQRQATMNNTSTKRTGRPRTGSKLHNHREPMLSLPFSSSVPGMKNSSLGSTKYKASFLMLKMSGMGDPQLRARLHMRRVHKWAGHLFPDDCEC